MPSCPSCTAPLVGDETYCLQCGTRLVPEPEPRPSWTVPAVIVGVIAVVAVASVFIALREVESDAERQATKDVPVVERPETSTTAEERPRGVASWPEGDSAYTVVLAQEEDEASARARAAAAVGSGVPAGVLDSDRYPTLEPDTWMLFAGRFSTREDAAAEAAAYAAEGFPDAEARFVSEDEPPIG